MLKSKVNDVNQSCKYVFCNVEYIDAPVVIANIKLGRDGTKNVQLDINGMR